jgi:hypothetical protein
MSFRNLGLLALALSLFAPAGPAAAGLTNHPGSVCRSLTPAGVSSIDYSQISVRSINPLTYTDVICPLTRSGPFGVSGATIFVAIQGGDPGFPVRCTAYSYSHDGFLLGSASATSARNLPEIKIDLTGAGLSERLSDYTLVCSLPGPFGGIRGIDVDEAETRIIR